MGCSSSNGTKTFLQRVGPDPLVPHVVDTSWFQPADVGVGRGPGGPPHFAFVHPRQGVFDGAKPAH